MESDFIIPLNGLSDGKASYAWTADKEFFGSFGNSEIIDAGIDVEARIDKSGDYLGIDCTLKGSVTVPCDRCLEPLEIHVGKTFLLSVKFGEEPAQEDEVTLTGEEDERETVYLPSGSGKIDLSQAVYDYTLLSLPAKRVHPEGGCNPEMTKYITEDAGKDSEPEIEPGKNPFEALKGLYGEDKGGQQ